ncbi:outer membrane lipoprotein-sorting protein [Thermodesulfatator atlanticus]
MRAFLVLLIIAIANPVWALTGEEIAWKVYNRPQGKDSLAESVMILKSASGREKTRTMKVYFREDQKARYTLIRFLSPKDIAGTAFLSIAYHNGDEDQFLYLPALKRTRRIAGSFRFHRFVNSDFIYEDLERHYPPKYHHELLKEEPFQGDPCYVVKSWPKKKKDSIYGYWIQWITKEGFLPVRIDLYDRKGRLSKRFTAKEWKKIQGYWTVLSSEMEDLKKKHKTILKINKIVYDQGLDPSIFTKRSLERW